MSNRTKAMAALCAAVMGLHAAIAGAVGNAESILQQTAFPGGVAVQIGDDTKLLSELVDQRPQMLGHLLVASPEQAASARSALVENGLHGKLTASAWDGGQLPFIAGFVNLLIADMDSAPAREEILRVLAPGGKAIIGGELVEKPRPDTMDDWPMMMHSPSGNAVSKDKLAPPLTRMQWVGSPRWSRHHDTMSSVSACVSGDNKLFYVFDEGMTFSPYLPSDWKLIARDAFNGVVLWKLPLDGWVGNLYRLKLGPATLPRRVVVHGKKVYATLGIEAPVSVIDTDTGKILRALPGTECTEEIICDEGRLYLVADINEEKPELTGTPRAGFDKQQWFIREKQVICFDLEKNQVAWRKPAKWAAPLTLATARGKVYFYNGDAVVALNAEDGAPAWRSEDLPVYKNMLTYFGPKLVVENGVIMYSGGEDYVNHKGSTGKVSGLSMENGKTLWTASHPASGYQSPEDLFVVDGQAWAASVTSMSGTRGDPSKRTGDVTAINTGSGEEAQRHGDVDAYWFHHRCYGGKSTEDYMILSRTGTEFVDYKTGDWTLHHWVRGACLFGILPANNLLYAPPHPCGCYIGAKMFGFTALAGADPDHKPLAPVPESGRLTTFKNQKSEIRNRQSLPTEWPTYRRDLARSGSVPGIATPSKKTWSVRPGGHLTQPVIAGGKVIVSSRDNPAVTAYDALTGEQAWRFIPGAQVDSSPAVWEGRVYFGSADGMVRCLDLADGSEVWNFHAAPTDARHMYFEKLESTHPVHGNVLVMDGKVYTVAGRSMFTDGGMRFLILDALTGRKLTENIMDDKVPGTDEELQMRHEILSMPMALPDILSTNGEKIFMRYQPFDLDGNRLDLIFDRALYGTIPEDYDKYHPATTTEKSGNIKNQLGEDAHLFSSTGFLDESWWHRTYWIYGKSNASGHGGYTQAGASGAPAGRMIAFDDDRIYTWGRMQRYFKWSEEYVYHLHGKDYEFNEKWSVMVPILVRAMVASDDSLHILGPAELMRQDKIKPVIGEDRDVQNLMRDQEKALLGERGSRLLTVDNASGKILAGVKLDNIPELDGMSGAYGNLYLVTADGTLTCLGDKGHPLEPLSDTEIATLNENSKPPVFPPGKKGKGKGKGNKSAPKKKPS